MRDVVYFAEYSSGIKLRGYQRIVAESIIRSVRQDLGLSFVVIFPRQSGKNELQAQIESYLLALYVQHETKEMVKISPTYKPQSLNAMRRLERILLRNKILHSLWQKESGYIYKVLGTRISFLSGSATANVVGHTANLLLQCDEAQDITITKFDKDINPMAASTNATKVFWGTAWTNQTLLAREKRAALEAEKIDGIKRVFIVDANDVRLEVPAYGKFVDSEIVKHGINHPYVKTQYFCQEIDSAGGMFPPERQVLMRGEHLPLMGPVNGETYAFLLDFAGEDEGKIEAPGEDIVLSNAGRDSTALTIVRVDLSRLTDLQAPVYQVVMRRLWTGTKHSQLYTQLISLAEQWSPRYFVCDNTGIGAGITSFLVKSFGELRVIPFTFTSSSKSELGWNFLSIIETGRFKDHRTPIEGFDPHTLYLTNQELFWQQVLYCQNEILPGPGRMMRWGVADGIRDAASGELIHDDLIISAALCTLLDEQTWGLANSEVVDGIDPISDLGEAY
jgi:hypothetical protein